MSVLSSKIIKLFSLFMVFLFLPLIASGNGIGILNYDNDPDLKNAMFYDLEYTKDKNNADRAKSEEYYLAYLEKDIPNFQKAKVYSQLGVMYATAFSPERGEKANYKKAADYFEKVLELEPERVGRETIRARTMLCSSPIYSKETKIAKGLDVYEWLSSLDEEKIKKLVLPSAPNDLDIPNLKLSSLSNYIQGVKNSTAINVVASAKNMPNNVAILKGIIRRFPETEIEEHAKTAIKQVYRKPNKSRYDLLDKSVELCQEDNAQQTENWLKSLPKDDVNSLAPINWQDQLAKYNITNPENINQRGLTFSCKDDDFEGSFSIATYPSMTEAQLELASWLGHLPVKLAKGAFNNVFVGDASFHGTSNILFVRKNFIVGLDSKEKSPKALEALNELADTIDKLILSSTNLLKESAPYQVIISSKDFKINEQISITVSTGYNRSFTVRSELIKGSALSGQSWTTYNAEAKQPQILTFQAKETGRRTIKIYVCETSGMVWTYYLEFNAFRG